MERLTIRHSPSSVTLNKLADDGQVLLKLADYEDAEEQGLLLRLPCKVGSTVYYINSRTEEVESTVILRYWILGFKNFVIDNKGRKCSFKQFGKTVFLTREEAETALAEMQKG